MKMNDNIAQDEAEYDAIRAAIADLDEYYTSFLRDMADIYSTLKKDNCSLERTA